MLPTPITSNALTPVLVANTDIHAHTKVQEGDFRTIFMKKKDVPDLAVREFAHIKGGFTFNYLRADSFIFFEDVHPPQSTISFHLPPNQKVVAIKLSSEFEPFNWYLLSKGDVISINTMNANTGETAKCVIPRCTLFSKSGDGEPILIGVLLNEAESELVYQAQKSGLQIVIDRPNSQENSSSDAETQ